MNEDPDAPPGTITGRYYSFWAYTYDASSLPNSNPQPSALSKFISFENPGSVSGSSHPWYVFFSYQPSQSDTSIPSQPIGQEYFWRSAYDGYYSVKAWWGLKSGKTSPTITISSTQPVSTQSGYVDGTTDQDVIMWVCDNSDYFTRYPQQTWTEPVVVQDGVGFGWSMLASNVPTDLVIEFHTPTTNWVAVYSQNNVPQTGGYTATQSGFYRFRWTYSLNDVLHTEYSDTFTVDVPAPPGPVFESVVTTLNPANPGYTITAVVSNAQSVALQMFQSNAWVTVKFLDYSAVDGKFAGHIFPTAGYRYRLLASDGTNTTEYILFDGQAPGGFPDTEDISGYIQSLGAYVSAFVALFPDLFAWMPVEVRAVLISAIIIAIILGLIGWLKS